MESEDEDGVHRLEGSTNEKGGLIIKKKPAAGANFEFKVPKTSLLGLDKLAGILGYVYLRFKYFFFVQSKIMQ